MVWTNIEAGDSGLSARSEINTLGALVDVINAKVEPPIQLKSRQDVLDNGTLGSGEIVLDHGAYLLGVITDMGADSMVVEGGSVIIGTSAELSSITSTSAIATVIFRNGGFVSSGMIGQAGIKINNAGSGASILATGSGTIVFFNNLFTNDGDLAMVINDTSGVAVSNYTTVNGTDGIRMTGTANAGAIIRGFNPINTLGKGIDIQGDITSGALSIIDANITSTGNAVEVTGDIKGMEFSGDAVSQAGNGVKISGAVTGGLLLSRTNILSFAEDAMDISGAVFSSFIAQQAGITAIADGKFGLRGDAANANVTGAGIVSTSFIDGLGAGGGALAGITKKDTSWSFTKAGSKITDSRNIGSYRLVADATTTISEQGEDGAITAYIDAGGGETQVTSVAHGRSNGDSVSIYGTDEYNGILTVSGVTTDTFNIPRAFVTDEATGNWESGWVKMAGTTEAGSTIERFTMSANNELTSLDSKTLPVTLSATISGSKSGSPENQYQFALFEDLDDGKGFVKINGSLPADFTNRGGSAAMRVSLEMGSGSRVSIYIRNYDGTTDFDAVALSVDVGLS